MYSIALLCALIFSYPAAASTQKASPNWIATWSAAPQAGDTNFDNQTIRMVVRTTLGGDQVRVRFSNEYGKSSLYIGSAHVALRQQGSTIIPGSDRTLTFSGQPSMVVPPGAYALTDPVELNVPQLSDLAVSIYLPGITTEATTHGTGLNTTYISPAGDFTGAPAITSASTTFSYYCFTEVYVATKSPARAIVALGDSITDGGRSTPDTNSSWPSVLGKLMLTKAKDRHVAVLNEGIGGNRVLHQNVGTNALARFDRDVFERPGVSTVVYLEGINDIGAPDGPGDVYRDQVVTPADLIQAMRQLIARCHLRKIKIIGATLTPYTGAVYFSSRGEATRKAVNEWIRTSGAFDAVVDFDKMAEDPARPGHLLAKFDCGDNLHPSDAGYQAMAHAVFEVLEKMGE